MNQPVDTISIKAKSSEPFTFIPSKGIIRRLCSARHEPTQQRGQPSCRAA